MCTAVPPPHRQNECLLWKSLLSKCNLGVQQIPAGFECCLQKTGQNESFVQKLMEATRAEGGGMAPCNLTRCSPEMCLLRFSVSLSIYGDPQKPSAFKEVLEEREVQRLMKRIGSSICSWPCIDLHVILGELLGGAWP